MKDKEVIARIRQELCKFIGYYDAKIDILHDKERLTDEERIDQEAYAEIVSYMIKGLGKIINTQSLSWLNDEPEVKTGPMYWEEEPQP